MSTPWREYRSTGTVKEMISRYLDTNGDGTGTKQAIGDYSAGVDFYIAPPPGQIYRIARLIVYVHDTRIFDPDKYGDLGGALGTGIFVKTKNASGDIKDLTDGIPITENAAWGRTCYDATMSNYGGTPANESLHVRWTFTKSGTYIRLVGDDGEFLTCELNDNMTGLIEQTFLVQGYIE